MDQSPTVLILAGATSFDDMGFKKSSYLKTGENLSTSTDYLFLKSQIETVISCNLPVRLIGTQKYTHIGRDLLPWKDVIDVEECTPFNTSTNIASLISTGVFNSTDAFGWVFLPLGCYAQPQMLKRIASQIPSKPVAYPTNLGTPSFPIGFSVEFFSELVKLQSDRELDRLLARYPAYSFESGTHEAPIFHEAPPQLIRGRPSQSRSPNK